MLTIPPQIDSEVNQNLNQYITSYNLIMDYTCKLLVKT